MPQHTDYGWEHMTCFVTRKKNMLLLHLPDGETVYCGSMAECEEEAARLGFGICYVPCRPSGLGPH